MSRPRARIVLLSAVLALGLAGAAAALDHFAVYEVTQVPVGFGVLLRDQFGPAKQAKVFRITHFANPTRKIHRQTFGVQDANHHHTWFAIFQPQTEPRRTVRFRNQFGQYSVDIKDPRFLLVPAQKTSHQGSSPPQRLDHYKCYRVIAVNTAPPVGPLKLLGDQFGSQENVAVGRPILFCPPVRKARPGQVSQPIFNPVDHLAIYPVRPQPKAVVIRAKDQFGHRALNVIRKVMLAVPTQKQAVVAHPN